MTMKKLGGVTTAMMSFAGFVLFIAFLREGGWWGLVALLWLLLSADMARLSWQIWTGRRVYREEI